MPIDRTAVLVPAAGRGERLGPGAPKALRTLRGTPILTHALRMLCAAPGIDLVVTAVPPGQATPVRAMLARDVVEPLAGTGAPLEVIEGGATRQDSVALMLAALPPDVTVVLVHDAARVLTPADLVAAVAAAVRAGHDAVIPALPVTDTIKSVRERLETDTQDADVVEATLDRARLRAVQTPQGFRRDLLERAHEAARRSGAATATDDAGMVERLGAAVTVIPGHVEAFKVTTPVDLALAEALLGARTPASTEAALDA